MSREPTVVDTSRVRAALAELQLAWPETATEFRTVAGEPVLVVFEYDRPPTRRDARLTNVLRMRFNSIPELLRWVRSASQRASEADTQTLVQAS